MKRLIGLISIMLMMITAVSASMLSPQGAEYLMGPHAFVEYKENYYDIGYGTDHADFCSFILSDNPWINIKPEDMEKKTCFINGKIFILDYPDGFPKCEWLLTEDEYLFEKGKFEAFSRQFASRRFSSLSSI